MIFLSRNSPVFLLTLFLSVVLIQATYKYGFDGIFNIKIKQNFHCRDAQIT